MPSCVVKWCKNHSGIQKKKQGITFHRFPKDNERRENFIQIIRTCRGQNNWTPSKSSVICSLHFDDNDLYKTKEGLLRMATDAVPKKFLFGPPNTRDENHADSSNSSEDRQRELDHTTSVSAATVAASVAQPLTSNQNESPGASLLLPEPPMKVIKVEFVVGEVAACRACLATDARLYDVTTCGLNEDFVKLAGVPVSTLNGLRHLCLLCCKELSKYAAFRDRCQRVQGILATLHKFGPLKMDDIKAVDRDFFKLRRNLTITPVEIVDIKDYEIPLSTPVKSEKNDTEVVFVNTDFEELNKESYETISIEVEQIKDVEMDKVIVKQENGPSTSKKRKSLGSSEVSMKVAKIENSNTEDIEKEERKPALKKRKVTKATKINSSNTVKSRRTRKIRIGDDFYPDFDYKAYENKYKVKIELLSKDEQKAEVEERKLTSNYLKSPHKCDLCGKGFQFLSTLTNHMSYHDRSVGPFECEVCHIRSANKGQHYKHRDLHRIRFTCHQCGFVSRTKVGARRHFEFHAGITHACPHCSRVFARLSSCLNHARVAHPERHVSCDLCGETCVSAFGVSLHKSRVHRENITQDFKCSTCDVNFNSLEALDKHTSTAPDCHTAVTPCVVCGENCESEAALSEHTALRHPPDQYRCHECDATFSSAASLDTHHRRKHLGQRPPQNRRRVPAVRDARDKKDRKVVCEICGLLVQNEAVLKFHLRIHNGDKPFKCSRCPKAFTTRHSRDGHLHTHTGAKPYRCELCSVSFRQVSNMKRHQRVVHLNQRKSFPCVLCGKTYTTRDNMKLHVSTVHQKMPWPKRKRRKQERELTSD